MVKMHATYILIRVSSKEKQNLLHKYFFFGHCIILIVHQGKNTQWWTSIYLCTNIKQTQLILLFSVQSCFWSIFQGMSFQFEFGKICSTVLFSLYYVFINLREWYQKKSAALLLLSLFTFVTKQMILIFLSKYSYRKLLIHSSSKSLQNILKMISSHEQKSRNDWYTTCWLIKKVKEDFFFSS